MNKLDLIDKIYSQQFESKKLSKIQIGKIVDSVFTNMSEELDKGKEIQISDFGTFGLTNKITKPIIKIKSKLEKTRTRARKKEKRKTIS
jgi:nucleoid DNA-binding protein